MDSRDSIPTNQFDQYQSLPSNPNSKILTNKAQNSFQPSTHQPSLPPIPIDSRKSVFTPMREYSGPTDHSSSIFSNLASNAFQNQPNPYQNAYSPSIIEKTSSFANFPYVSSQNPTQMLHAFGSAGTQSAGLWEFLRDAADSKQLHTAHAASTGLMSAYLAQSGFTGAEHILEGKQGLAAGMSNDADPSKLVDRLGSRWTIAETSFKYHASCRHTHPAADALLQVMLAHQLKPSDIAKVETLVHQGAIDVLGPVTDPATVHQSKFSMGTVLALIAHYQFAGLQEFDQHFHDQAICAFRDRVTMILDPEVDGAYPQRWIGKVKVYLNNGEVLDGRVDEPKGDPGNTLSRAEITDKAMRLAAFSGGAAPTEMSAAIERLWNIRKQAKMGLLIS